MKKIFIGAVALVLCVTLTGCGNSANSAAITSLCNQLDETANTISNVQTVSPSDINLTKSMMDTIATNQTSENIYSNVVNTQQALLNEEYYKMEILNATATLKNNLSADLKLSKTQINAVKDLTSSLNRYTNSVAYTKNEMNNSVKSISSMKKNVEKNADKINAKLNRLACNSNSRMAYYQNILNTLNQLDAYLVSGTPKGSTESAENIQNPENLQNDESAENTQNENGFLKKNIDTYISNTTNEDEVDNTPETLENCPNCPNCEKSNGNFEKNAAFVNRGVYGNPYVMPYGAYGGMNEYGAYRYGFPYRNGIYGAYNSNNINRMGYGGYGGVYGNPYGYGMYGGYGANGYGVNGYGEFGEKFNPSRNTDTYAPMMRNVDTYRYGTSGGTNDVTKGRIATVTTEPEQRLETFEKQNDDNTVEKVEEKSTTDNKPSEIKTDSTAEEKTITHDDDQAVTTSIMSKNSASHNLSQEEQDELNQTIIAH